MLAGGLVLTAARDAQVTHSDMTFVADGEAGVVSAGCFFMAATRDAQLAHADMTFVADVET